MARPKFEPAGRKTSHEAMLEKSSAGFSPVRDKCLGGGIAILIKCIIFELNPISNSFSDLYFPFSKFSSAIVKLAPALPDPKACSVTLLGC
jgi:hypothetical protein